MNARLSDEERKAIVALKRLAKTWPQSLWLFSGSGELAVLRMGENGEPAMTDNGCVDPDFIVETIDGIYNDGGGW